MNKQIELKPCPHCNGTAEIRGDHAPENWVSCMVNCLPFGRNKERLAEHWNTRPIEAQLQAENERLRKSVVILEPGAKPRTGDIVEFLGEFDSIFGKCVVARIGNDNHGYREVYRLEGFVCPEHVFYRIIMRSGKPVIYMRGEK